MPQKRWLLLAGTACGLLGGLFGAGGGLIAVLLLGKVGLPAEKCHATAIAVTLPLSVLGGIGYFLHGWTDFSLLWKLLPLGLVGAGVGAWLLPRIKTCWLHRIFGALLIFCALRMLFAR